MINAGDDHGAPAAEAVAVSKPSVGMIAGKKTRSPDPSATSVGSAPIDQSETTVATDPSVPAAEIDLVRTAALIVPGTSSRQATCNPPEVRATPSS